MAALLGSRVTVTVPATSANLGPGYDALGLALSLRDRVTAEVHDGPGPVITVTGEGSGAVPDDESHLVHRAMAAAFARMGEETPPLRLWCDNAVPHGRGLGSSSAAIVAGVCAARALVPDGHARLDDVAAFALAADLEGHPDNVAPAFFGGFTVAWGEPGAFRAVRAAIDASVSAVAFVPTEEVATELARGLLPEQVSHRDAAVNAGRAALLVAALAGRPDLLHAATEDRLHQRFREPAMPASLALVSRLRAAGHAAVVSGAGPSVLVLTGADVTDALLAAAPTGWRVLPLGVEQRGVVVSAG